MTNAIYDDGRYQVSASIVSTPSRLYPLANTTAGVRRDPLWMSIALCMLTGAGIFTYGDLLSGAEICAAAGSSGLALVIGRQTAILRLDAPGHPRTMIVSSRARIWKIFQAIRAAKLAGVDREVVLSTDD
mgnify:CR=1 FL=1